MCGRFVRKTPLAEVSKTISACNIESEPSLSYNISPGSKISVLQHDKDLIFSSQVWGIVPNWVSQMPPYRSIINIRYETLLNRRIFNNSLKNRRCLVLADGFFEWLKIRSQSVPYYFFLKEDKPLFFAGIWDYIGTHDGKQVQACAIITVPANELVGRFHERMPAIITIDNFKEWIFNDAVNKSTLPQLIKTHPAHEMMCYRVSEFVNLPQNNSQACITPVSDQPEKYEQLPLF